jgi:peptidoglycan/xylan/chitin deacetylase (PgdA/CDA1 family)
MPDVRTSVLMYHDVIEEQEPDASGFAGAAAATYKVDVDLFERHLDALDRRAGSLAAQPSTSARTPTGGSWLLTFDDGGVSASTHVANRLEARQWRGIFFITTDRIGTPGFLTVDEIRDLASRGHVIGSHSRSHPRRMSSCPPDEVRAEWHESVRVLTEMLEAPVTHASVPNGSFSRSVGMEASAAGIRYLYTSNPTRSRVLIDDCLVIGRYNVRATSSPAWVAAVAAGARAPRYAQWMTWTLKGIGKRFFHDGYRQYRERWRPHRQP